MTQSHIRSRTVVVLFILAVLNMASGYLFETRVSAAGFSGKIATTTFDGQDEHFFASKEAVYLNGGPVNAGGPGLPDGTYYFQVTGPSGNDLLSTDPAVCRQLLVVDGVIAAAEGPACQHSTGIPGADGSLPIKLMPFNDTSNPGRNYKAWLIRQTSNTVVAADGIHINFKNSDAKQQVFKSDTASCTTCGPTVLLAGRKFYDANANAVFDEGEAGVEGVEILVQAGGISSVVTTDSSGAWGFNVSTGSEYTVLEYLPYTGEDGEPGSYWQQTYPAADGEGFRGYVGIAAADTANLNFGNICYIPDSSGNPVASPSPCAASDIPPPPPTPEPTPTPCPDCAQTAVLSGSKYYDGNSNGVFDTGEAPVEGVKIAVTLVTVDGVTLTFATTDASGNWTMTVPVGAQYLISEYLPDTDFLTEPDGYWEQTGPAPDAEGFRGYIGTVSGDQGGFNFGNVCFHTDIAGNPIQSSTPCTVGYPPSPPTEPTPTPTPTPEDQ